MLKASELIRKRDQLYLFGYFVGYCHEVRPQIWQPSGFGYLLLNKIGLVKETAQSLEHSQLFSGDWS